MKKRLTILRAAVVLMLGLVTAVPAEAAGITVEINGEAVVFDQQPIMYNDRVMVPMRALAESLGAEVGWDDVNNCMWSERGNDVLVLAIDDPVMLVNGEAVLLDAPPMIVNGRTLAPVRAISEGYAADVEWDQKTQTVSVTLDYVEWSPEAYAYEVFELTNAAREKYGLPLLKWNDALTEVAMAHSQDMATRNYFDHYTPEGLSPGDRLRKAGISYSAVCENIAAGQATPEEAVAGWLNSPGHRANILDPDITEMGVGYASGGYYGDYWTQVFRRA